MAKFINYGFQCAYKRLRSKCSSVLQVPMNNLQVCAGTWDEIVSRWASNRWSWKVTNRSGCVAIQGHKSTSFPERSPTCKRRECSRTPHSSANIKTLASQPSLVNPGPKGSDNIDSLAVSPTPETSKYTFPSAELCRHVSSFNLSSFSQVTWRRVTCHLVQASYSQFLTSF